MNRTRQFVFLFAAVGWLEMAHAQSMPNDYDSGKNRAAERGAAEQAGATKQQTEAERQRRKAAEAKAAELERQVEEQKRRAAEARTQAAEAQKKVGAGGTVVGAMPVPLSVFRDKLTDGSFGPEMIVIPAGEFLKGVSVGTKESKTSEGQQRSLSIDKPFALGKTEVTQRQWRTVMSTGLDTSFLETCDNCPVANVSWYDVQTFISRMNRLTGKTYRLPSRPEWEYACAAGKQHEYCGSDDVGRVAWYRDNSRGEIQPVAGKQPNAWGLVDMTGNVWEWIEDCGQSTVTGSTDCEQRTVLGGSATFVSGLVKAGTGLSVDSSRRFKDVGLRLARELP